ncbi:MAG: DinB family protein [Ferruginibacter sp.]
MQDNFVEEILIDFKESSMGLLETISLFRDDQFNTIPFKDSWTAGQVAEHIFKSESGISGLLNGKNKPTLRMPDENVQQIKNIFLDFSTKMKSPEFILPSEEKKERNDLYKNLKASSEKIEQLAGSLDLTKTYYDFPFPGIGELTGIELMTFITCHAKRHTHQLKKILDSF